MRADDQPQDLRGVAEGLQNRPGDDLRIRMMLVAGEDQIADLQLLDQLPALIPDELQIGMRLASARLCQRRNTVKKCSLFLTADRRPQQPKVFYQRTYLNLVERRVAVWIDESQASEPFVVLCRQEGSRHNHRIALLHTIFILNNNCQMAHLCTPKVQPGRPGKAVTRLPAASVITV